MARTVDTQFWQDYFNAYNSKQYDKLMNEFYAEDAIFQNPKQKFVGREAILKHFQDAHTSVDEKLEEVTRIISPEVTAIELNGYFVAQRDMPDYYVRPLKKGEKQEMGMGVFYHLKGDKIARVMVYWMQ